MSGTATPVRHPAIEGATRWYEVRLYGFAVTRGDRSIAITCARWPSGWIVGAVELAKGSAADLAAIFNDHAHDVVGERETLEDAQDLAEAYAAKWALSREQLVPCRCETIQGDVVSVT